MKLEDLIDLEAQLAADTEGAAAALHRRDRAAFERIPPAIATSGDRDALLTAWLAVLREDSVTSGLGASVAVGHRMLGYALVAGGLASGWALAAALLRFEQGGEPVNVGAFLVGAVAAPLTLLVVGVSGVPLAARFPGVPLLGDVRAALRWLAAKLELLAASGEERLAAETRERWRVARARLRTRASLYGQVERWILFGATQTFATAFSVGILLCCAREIVFSDLAFAWSTTVASIDADLVHRLCRALAVPFAWALPDAVPSLELVEKTQYFRLEGRYAGAAPGSAGDAQLAGQWWNFVVGTAVTYGLLPRVATWLLARAMRARALRHLPLDSAEIDRLVRRMRAPYVETREREPGGRVPEPAPPVDRGEETAPTAGEPGTLVRWRGVPTEPERLSRALEQTFGTDVARTLQAGGADFAADAAVVDELSNGSGPIFVVAEAWEPPDKSIRQFLRELRTATAPRRKLLVALVSDDERHAIPPADDSFLDIWRDRLALLEDPYLAVEPLAVPE